jgi:hypothetical protein
VVFPLRAVRTRESIGWRGAWLQAALLRGLTIENTRFEEDDPPGAIATYPMVAEGVTLGTNALVTGPRVRWAGWVGLIQPWITPLPAFAGLHRPSGTTCRRKRFDIVRAVKPPSGAYRVPHRRLTGLSASGLV